MAQIGKDIKKAAQLLSSQNLVGIPTETVYGLAANALDPAAVVKIFEAKQRPFFDPLIVHVRDLDEALACAEQFPPGARALAEKFWPGPLTVVVKKKPVIPDLVTAGLPSVGLRCPANEMTLALLREAGFPLAAPSANPFGYVSPTSPEHVQEQLGDRIPYILDGGQCSVGIESTIVGFEDDTPMVYRLGGLSLEQIESVTGPVIVKVHSDSNPIAPGQLTSHYAPGRKVIIGDLADLLQRYPAHSTGILSFQHDFNSPFQRILSPTGRLDEAARNLFTALRDFDKMPIDYIIAELVPDTGLGRAINDRLRRAAAN